MAAAVTLPILGRYTEKEYGQLKEDIQRGHISQDSAKLIGMKECFLELCVHNYQKLEYEWDPQLKQTNTKFENIVVYVATEIFSIV